MHVGLTTEPIDVAALISAVQSPGHGAIATFLGVVRDHSDGRPVHRLDYEAYVPMAEQEMRRIAGTVFDHHSLGGIAMVHRLGSLAVGEVSVAVVTAAAHRGPALTAWQEAVEQLKPEVPIWKREHHPDGARWVDASGCVASEGDHVQDGSHTR